MISTIELIYGIDQKLNKLSTNAHQSIAIEDKILILNEAQIALIKSKVSPNNIYKIGLDGFKKRYQDLQFLIENAEDHKLIPNLSDKNMGKYIIPVSSITPKFMFYIDGYAIADKGICKNKIIYVNADLVKHADIKLLLRDSNFKPSFEYQETIVDISSDELHIYSDNTFTIKEFYLDYVRYPRKINIEGYVDFDGTDSINQDCELEDYLKDELLDIAVERLAMYTGNAEAVNAAKERSQTNE